MKKNLKKLKPIVLTVIGYGALGGVLFLGDQTRRIYKKIETATSCDVLSVDKIQPTYIYIEDPFLQEKIQAGFSVGTERVKLTRFHRWLRDKIEESFLFRSWYYSRKNLPWKLLSLAQDENQIHRIRAVRSLASLNNLIDADYQQLAQACDLRTAVGLARSTENVRFLLDPPYYKQKPNRNDIIKNLHEFFIKLSAETSHPCLQHFVSKFVTDVSHADSTVFDEDFRINFDKSDFIRNCLEALLHHSWTDDNAKQIITFGGLPILMEIYKLLRENSLSDCEDLIALSRVISNLSCCPNCAQSFFMSGWIKILGVLAQHKDIRVSSPAQRALLNFDEDDLAHEGRKFMRRIFPLHPTERTSIKPKVDVIFIHGLLGEIFVTWRQRDYKHCGHKSPLELLAVLGKLLNFKISNHLAFPPHLLAPKKVPSFPIPEPGFTASDERAASYQTNKPLDQDFIVDVRELDHWEKMTDSYEIVLSDIPVDDNCNCSGPFYGSRKDIECGEEFTKCWPKDWLAEDCSEIRLIGVNYETNISKWTMYCTISPMSGTLHERSKVLMDILIRAGVGTRPIVWIGHSMGGLLVKGVLTLARQSDDPSLRSLVEQTKGIAFYSTPHKGSHLAALNTTSQMIVWPSVEVQELRENSPRLLELHEQFLDLVKTSPIKVISFAERESTYITSLKFEIRFVNSNSADPDIGECFGIPLDHLSICKPAGRQSFLYQKLKHFIREIIQDVTQSS